VKDEAARRISSGEINPEKAKLAVFARDLAEWWELERQKCDPHAPPLSARTIENNIRPIWRNKA
jgi:hypothetical protein